jgi:hypothetical protein
VTASPAERMLLITDSSREPGRELPGSRRRRYDQNWIWLLQSSSSSSTAGLLTVESTFTTSTLGTSYE